MSASKCFAQFHMSCAEYGLWDQCRALSHKSGTLFFDGRKMAARFKGVSYSKIYRLLDSLVLKGWITKFENSQPRRTDGTYTATQYWVLSHDQWVAKYGKHECSKGWKNALQDAHPVSPVQQAPVSPVQQVKNQPVPKQTPACFKTPVQPVSPVQHSLVKTEPTGKKESEANRASAQDFSFLNDPLTAELPLGNPNVAPVAPVQLDQFPALVWDSRNKDWGARRGINRALTLDEITELQRRNRLGVLPPE